ncbi:MAG: uroporphyrinogen decarboxylase family protein [bacterium]
MTIRERIIKSLHGEMADIVPFTVYAGDIPQGETERELRNAGLGFLRRVPIYKSYMDKVKICKEEYWENGKQLIRKFIHTPVGEVEERLRTGGGFGTKLRFEFYIKKAEDYKIVEFMIQNTFYKPNYEEFLEIEKDMGEDGYVAGNLPYTPMQEMIIMLMGPERFAVDFYEHPELINSLYETMFKKHRELYQIAAESPAEVIWHGDNITSEMIGLERFQKYVVNCYNELASHLHPKGKLVAVHMDGKLNHLKHAIADSSINIVEAFTPPPDGDLSIPEARRLWKDKVLWINYPASFHLKTPKEIRVYTLKLLKDAVPGDRFLISNTENLTPCVWQRYMKTVTEVLKEKGKLPLS